MKLTTLDRLPAVELGAAAAVDPIEIQLRCRRSGRPKLLLLLPVVAAVLRERDDGLGARDDADDLLLATVAAAVLRLDVRDLARVPASGWRDARRLAVVYQAVEGREREMGSVARHSEINSGVRLWLPRRLKQVNAVREHLFPEGGNWKGLISQ